MADQQGPPFNGNEGAFVKLSEASGCTKKYRGSKAFTDLKNKKGAYLGGRKILRLLSQEDAVGIRAYIGLNDSDEPHLFVVGVDSAGNDIIVGDLGIENGENGLVLNRDAWCPPICPNGNELNQD